MSNGDVEYHYLMDTAAGGAKGPKRDGTTYTTMVNTIKSIVGTGVLTLPYAMKSAGLVPGLIAFAVVGLYTMYSMWLISESFYMKPNVSTYGQLCESALGTAGRIIGGVNIVILEILVGAGYLVFVGINFASVVEWVAPWIVMLLCLPIIACFIFQSNVNSLSFISTAGNIAIVTSLAIILYYASINTEGNGTYELGGSLSGMAVFLGSTIFMFSGHAEVIAIVKPMSDRSQYPKVLLSSIAILFSIYIVFGVAVYISFGAHTEGLIFNNMDGNLVAGTKVFHSLAILFSIPVKLWPAFEAIELVSLGEDWQEKDTTTMCTRVTSVIIRLSLLGSMAFTAIAIPDFAFLVAFCGSFCISLVGMVLPPLIYIILSEECKDVGRRLSLGGKIIHWILFLIGVSVCTASSGNILWEKIKAYNDNY